MSIIISKEREISIELIQGMKEMKEILIQKEMLRDVVDNGFWEILYIRKYFQNEIIYSPFIYYTLDNMGDSNDLLKEINETQGDYVSPELARKVSLYYMAKNELVRDIRYYLCKKYNINYNKELEARKARNKKEGK